MQLPETYAENNHLNVVIETPCNTRNKFAYDKASGLFKLKKTIPPGLYFPCDMGFITSTYGEDGDPLDALVLMDEPGVTGCLIECRLLGVIKATQKDKEGKKIRNDRFITVPAIPEEYDHIKTINSIDKIRLNSIVDFFVNTNGKEKHKHFEIIGIGGMKEAQQLIKDNIS
jgi:inorganic pyrophosphatase